MVTLPQNLTENLLSPAPGDNPFAGVTDQLRVSVWDASAAGGVGGLLATKVLPLQYNWLQHELQQALLKRQAAGSSGTGAAGAAGGGSGPPGLQRAASSKHSNFVTLSMELTGDPATAAAAAAGGGGPAAGARPPAESEGGQGLDPAAAFQLRMALRIDDSQVDPSWFPKRREQQQAALVAAAAAAQGSSTSSPGSAPGSNGLGASGRGWQAALATRHALRLAEGAVWCPFSWSNLQRTSGGGALGGHSAVLPIKGIARGLALEVEYAGGWEAFLSIFKGYLAAGRGALVHAGDEP
jgi:vacuolar protein sorting-associated protein 13A/C